MSFVVCESFESQARQAGIELNLSPMFEYNNTRIEQNTFNKDTGSNPDTALYAAKKYGICDESLFTYSPNNLYVKPSDAAYQNALTHKIDSYKTLDPNVTYTTMRDQIKHYLIEGKEILTTIKVRPFIDGESGPLPAQISWSNNPGDPIRGLHEIAIIGADDSLNGGSYIFKNQWTTGYGDNGYGTIKYTQFSPQMGDLIMAEVLTGSNGMNFEFTNNKTIVSEIYCGIFNRSAENSGLEFWAGCLDRGAKASDVANALFTSSEANYLKGLDSVKTVDLLYENIVGRKPDIGGEKFFANLLDVGYTKGEVAFGMISEMHKGLDPNTGRFENRALMSNLYGITYHADDNHHDVAVSSLIGITNDFQSVEVKKIGVHEALYGHIA